MTEDRIRELIEQADPNGEISDAVREELIASFEDFIVPNEAELGTLPETPQVVWGEDWRVNAANAARNIGKDMNIL